MISFLRKHRILSIIAALLIVIGCYFGYREASTVSIGPDEIGVVVAHFGTELPIGQTLAGPGQKGVREQVLGPGCHRIEPFIETVERFPIVHVSTGTNAMEVDGKKIPPTLPEVGLITSLVGKPLREGEVFAKPGEKGPLQKVLVPGRYALNPYAVAVTKVPATIVEAGYVGVVTHMVGNAATTDLVKTGERGVLEDPIPPGLYWLNTQEFHVTPIKVGYQEIAFENSDAITFPSADGDTIKVDATVIWGILPGDAPHIVKQFGSEKAVVENVIKPQAESKARVAGSNYRSREFVEGDSRERFQDEFFRKLREELETKHVRVLLALVRNIEVPQSVRRPIQASKIAVEEELTNRARTESAKVLTELSLIRGNVQIESAKARTESEKLALEESTRSTTEASRIQADTKLKVSELESQAAQLRGESKKLLALAASDVAIFNGKTVSDGLKKRYASFGDAESYGLWRFAEALNNELKIEVRDAPPHATSNSIESELLKLLQNIKK